MIKLPENHLRADLGDITQKIGDKNSNKGAGAPLEFGSGKAECGKPLGIGSGTSAADCGTLHLIGLIQYVKALLIKMPIEPKNVFQPVMPHGDKADAIGKA